MLYREAESFDEPIIIPPERGFSMRQLITAILAAAVVAPLLAQEADQSIYRRVRASSTAQLESAIGEFQARVGTGEFRELRTQTDTQLPRRLHIRYAQQLNGVEVWGSEVVVQEDRGVITSINGAYVEGGNPDVTPSLTADAAVTAARATLVAIDVRLEATSRPRLFLLPVAGEDGLVLCYHFHLRTETDLLAFLVDADTGEIRLTYSDLQRQRAVGSGTGVWGDTKKVSTSPTGQGGYRTADPLRPPDIFTYSMRGDPERFLRYLINEQPVTAADLAWSPNNIWSDRAAVDAHTYSGLVYDYFYTRFGRRGLDGSNFPIRNFVHPIDNSHPLAQVPSIREIFVNNAFWDSGRRVMVYGDGDQNLRNNFSGALDVVAHELTHGITDFSSNLIYCNESGALSESFSDIMGVSVEFYYQARGPEKMQSDWYIGEDVFFGEDYAIRSFARPTDFGDPDHYANRYQADCRPETDNGGVHINSSIPNHAFYLFVMGGKRAPTGEDIDGIGFENLEQAEKIFYRAFTFFLTPNSNFSDARQATQQAARELYGTGYPPYSVQPTPMGDFEHQLHWAWDVVGVQVGGV